MIRPDKVLAISNHFLPSQGAPVLPKDEFSAEFCDFIGKCLLKDASNRPSVNEISR